MANAIAFQKMGDHVLAQSYANCFQPVCTGCVTHYSQGGKMFLPGGPPDAGSSNRTWLSPHGYASQLLASSFRPQGVECNVSDPSHATLKLQAMAAIDDRSMVVRVLNPTSGSPELTIDIVGGVPQVGKPVVSEVLTGPSLAADNSWEAPTAVSTVRASHEKWVDHGTLAPYSLTVFTIPLKTNDEEGFLGIATDDWGLVHRPPPALTALQSDFQFLHNHRLVAGDRLDLAEISEFGAQLHLQLDLQLANAPVVPPASTNSSVVSLSLLGGAAVFTLEHTRNRTDSLPPVCTDGAIHKDASCPGQLVAMLNASEGDSPEWCREQCCLNKEGCSGWTLSLDGGSNGHRCRLSGYRPLQPGSALIPTNPRFQSWAGTVTKAGSGPNGPSLRGTTRVSFGEIEIGESARPFAASLSAPSCGNKAACTVPEYSYPCGRSAEKTCCCTPPGSPQPGYVRLPRLEIFVSGPIVQAYFNGGVVAQGFGNASGGGAAVGLRCGAGRAIVTLQAWNMAAADNSSVLQGAEAIR